MRPSNKLNQDFALGFVKRPLIAIKSGCLETESAAADMVKSKIATQWLILKQLLVAITCPPWRRNANAYFGLKRFF